MPGAADEDDADGPYDSFLRAAARITDGVPRAITALLPPGARLLGGRFEIERALGTGGMGVVYAARDHQRGCVVAVKTLRAATPDALRRLRDEFLVLYDLAHPNLVSPGELFDDGGRWFFSMELVDGVDFLRHVRPGGVLDVARLRRALAGLVAGLGFLHVAGVVHRDVKPSNVLCTHQRVVVLDFGLASDGGDTSRAGTLPYMAPEQHAASDVGPAADWYAVGVMLWAALTGRLPFSGDAADLAARKRRGAPAPDAGGDLAALAMALLDPDPARRPSGADLAQRLGVPTAPRALAMPFVGRDRELAEMHAAWTAAQHRAGLVVVRGPSGVGKSALLARFADRLRGDGAIVLDGRCHERVAMPYEAAHGIAGALAAQLRSDRSARTAAAATRDIGLLPAVFPQLLELDEFARAARAAPGIRDPSERRARVFDAFSGLIAQLAAHAPVVLVVDDLQWADRDGLALLRHVMAAAPPGVLLAAAARDDGPDPTAGWLVPGSHLAVTGLSPDDAEELVRRLASDAAAGVIAREAAGHPLHIAELVRHWRQSAGDAAPRLDDAIAARVRDLPVHHARALALIALAGPLPQDLIGEAAGLGAAAWWAALAALRASSLVRTHGPRGGDAVEPFHDRVRDTVAARLAPDEVVRGHARLAAVLEARGLAADHPERLAYHLEGAERPGDAAPWAERAGDQAARASAFDRAAALYQRALALAAHPPAHEVSLRARLGDALGNAGRGAPAAEAYLAGAALVGGDRSLELRRRAADQLLRAGHIDDGLRVIDGVLREVGLPAAGRRRWPLASLLVERARLCVRRWWGPARRTGDANAHRQLACSWPAVIGLAMTSPVRMAEYQTRHLRLALAAREPRSIAFGMTFEVMAGAIAGPAPSRSRLLLDAARAWAAQASEPLADAYIAMAEAMVGFLDGRWLDALAHCDTAERSFRDDCVGVAWEIGTVSHVALSCLWHMGRVAELRRRLPRALDEADRRGDRYAATQLRTALQPTACLMEGREDAARDELARAAADLPRHQVTLQHWQHMQSSALVELYAGAPADALALIDRQLPALRRAFVLRIHPVRAFTAYVRMTAWLGALAAGAPAPAPARLGASVRRDYNRAGADVALRSIPLLIHGGLSVLRGDLDAAVAAYHRAAAGFAALDMALIAGSARWRLGELLGGDQGRALIGQVRAAMSAEGIVHPERVVAMFAPVPVSSWD